MTRNSTSRTTGAPRTAGTARTARAPRTAGAAHTASAPRGRRGPAKPAYSPIRSLKNIGRIIVGDLRRLFGNITAVTMVIGLVAIPSLFAWFNVSANWDPFGSTGNLKFAVANDDEGYRSDLVPVKVNVGENVISALRANDQLDWVFTSREEAIEGTRSGEYYAAVVIPKSFSRDMMTVFSPDVKHASLTYYSNEKKNPLAPKVTSQGADTVQAQINEVFDTTISTVGLTIASELVDALDSDSATTLVGNLNTNIAQTAGRLNATADNLDQYGEVIASAQSLIDSSSDLVGKASDSAKAAQTATDQAKQGVASVSDALNSSAQSVSDALGQSADSYTTAATDIDNAMAAIGTQGTDTSKQLRALADKLDGQIGSYQTLRGNLAALNPQTDAGRQALERTLADLDDSIAKQQSVRDALNNTADNVDKGMANADQARADAKAKAQAASAAMDQASRNFDSGLKKKLDGMASAVSSAYSDGTEAATRLQSTVDDLSGSADSIAANMTAAHDRITTAAQTLRDSAGKMTALHDRIQKALDSDDMQAVKTALGDDPAALAASMVSPAGVNRHAVFTVKNFGSAMAPMYTALAMWLGALLMSLAILTQVSRERVDTLDRPRPHELYLGRFGVFAFVALLQSTVTCLGELAYLKIQCEHPMLFMLTGWTTSVVFAFIVYTLVVSFGNPGKALCVLIMVMQITGAGGAFPVAMLPEFFQNVHPFLPATHAVDAFRSAIAGIYGNDYWISMGRLLAFVLPMLLLGLVLRKPLISFNAKSIATLSKTKVLG